jgi:hypothetical protein
MMGIGPAEADRLSWWKYQAMLHTWAVRHTSDEESDEVEAPTQDFVEHRHAMLARSGIGKMVH